MEYVALVDGVNGARNLIPANTDIYNYIKDFNRDWYRSIFIYNDKHYEYNKEKHSLAGIRDVTTDRLVWDFDDKENFENARQDALKLVSRLEAHGVPTKDISLAFSGRKGFHVELLTDKRFTPEQFAAINLALAGDLKTNDVRIFDPQRIFRVMGTRHQSSKLFKLPINIQDLHEWDEATFRAMAASLDNAAHNGEVGVTKLPASIYEFRHKAQAETPAPKKTDMDVSDLNFKLKPRGFSNCKFAILNGFFPAGNRNNALMVVGATCRGLGYPKEVAYNMLKAAARLQGQRTGTEPFSKKEIWTNIIDHIYSDKWQGGQYTCKKEQFLKEICDSLGPNKCNHNEVETSLVHMEDMFGQFSDYATKIEENTVKTGIKALDDNARLTIGMPVALLGAPSSGKTTLLINILNNTSNANIHSVFFSMDMYGPLVYQKLVQKHFYGKIKNQDHLFEVFKHDKKLTAEINEKIKQEYANVRFCTKAGLTVQEMREIVSDYEQESGNPVKLVGIDYLECISGPYSDPTANGNKIAGELRDFATEMNKSVITLVQPPKVAGDASAPLTSMRQIKGSSMLEQSFRIIFGIYREGFGPKRPQYDKFITINALKNTMGELFSVDNAWDGRTGTIRELTEDGEMELRELRDMIAKEKADEQSY